MTVVFKETVHIGITYRKALNMVVRIVKSVIVGILLGEKAPNEFWSKLIQ